MNRHFSKEDMKMANEDIKMCSTLLAIREMQNKNTTRYHFTPTRMATISKMENRYWRRCREIGNLLQYWWEYKMAQLL